MGMTSPAGMKSVSTRMWKCPAPSLTSPEGSTTRPAAVITTSKGEVTVVPSRGSKKATDCSGAPSSTKTIMVSRYWSPSKAVWRPSANCRCRVCSPGVSVSSASSEPSPKWRCCSSVGMISPAAMNSVSTRMCMCPDPGTTSPDGSTVTPAAPIFTTKVGGTIALLVGCRKNTSGRAGSSWLSSSSDGASDVSSPSASCSASASDSTLAAARVACLSASRADFRSARKVSTAELIK